MIRLRFVSYSDITSDAISAYERGSPWDHVEAVMPDGSGYLGAVYPDGVAIRPVGYDKSDLLQELFVDLPTNATQPTAFYAALAKHIGDPYDIDAIVGFATGIDLHAAGHVICSALQVIALQESGYFPSPLVRKPHQIDPADLLLVLSGRVAIKAS